KGAGVAGGDDPPDGGCGIGRGPQAARTGRSRPEGRVEGEHLAGGREDLLGRRQRHARLENRGEVPGVVLDHAVQARGQDLHVGLRDRTAPPELGSSAPRPQAEPSRRAVAEELRRFVGGCGLLLTAPHGQTCVPHGAAPRTSTGLLFHMARSFGAAARLLRGGGEESSRQAGKILPTPGSVDSPGPLGASALNPAAPHALYPGPLPWPSTLTVTSLPRRPRRGPGGSPAWPLPTPGWARPPGVVCGQGSPTGAATERGPSPAGCR